MDTGVNTLDGNSHSRDGYLKHRLRTLRQGEQGLEELKCSMKAMNMGRVAVPTCHQACRGSSVGRKEGRRGWQVGSRGKQSQRVPACRLGSRYQAMRY